MKIHKVGHRIIFYAIVVIIFLLVIVNLIFPVQTYYHYIFYFLSLLLSLLIICFFRVPNRTVVYDDNKILSAADGEVVVIEHVKENEYFKDKRIQVSVFMSIYDIHINWYPISGIIKYVKYHKGKHLIASNPKASMLNEMTTVVVEDKKGHKILFRQIAGFVARRIVFYSKRDIKVVQGSECGFIKFGSRVDILLPLDAEVLVKLNQKVVGQKTVIAKFK